MLEGIEKQRRHKTEQLSFKFNRDEDTETS